MLDKTFELSARLEKARADLQTVDAELAALGGEKASASGTREAFEQWRNHYAATTGERERLALLIETLEREAARVEVVDDEAERRKKHAEQAGANAELAVRITADLALINSIAEPLLRDVAKAVIADRSINARLPEGLEPLISADVIARAKPGLPKEILSRERLWLWTRNDNGALIGDQDLVRDLGEGKGVIERPSPLAAVRCTKKLFEEICFHPAEPPQRARPLWQMMLMEPEGPSALYDGRELQQPREVLMALACTERATEPRERATQTEIVPLGAVGTEAAE